MLLTYSRIFNTSIRYLTRITEEAIYRTYKGDMTTKLQLLKSDSYKVAIVEIMEKKNQGKNHVFFTFSPHLACSHTHTCKIIDYHRPSARFHDDSHTIELSILR